ncbi:MAG TPA: hypothetical protein VGQ37_04965 [Vicinamibacterales bacterium]|jgi:hypothetical protein|nr:hypothetical protein [Vicinamibacterales bacterium]
MNARHGVVIAALLATVGGGPELRAQGPPDLTGVWTDYVEPQQPNALAGGQGALAPGLPFTEEARRKSDAYRKLVAPTGDTPGGFCLGPGMPSLILGGATYPMEIVQRPEQLTILYELHNEVRRIYFGARNAPEADRLPFRNGYSSGRWEGETLVVDTTHLVEQVDQRYPHSAQARVVERYHLTTGAKGERVLVIDFEMTDALFYTQPVTGQKKWMAVPNGHLLPYDCAEEGWRQRLEQLERGAAGR